MEKTSSSVNRISGDLLPMSRIKRLAWHFVNAVENRIPDRVVGQNIQLKSCQVSDEKLQQILETLPKTKGLPRALGDVFWQIQPYREIREAVGPLKILDIGCGNAKLFVEVFSGQSDIALDMNYTGVDIESNDDWNRLRENPKITLVAADICNYLEKNDPNFNLIVSQSALEHIEFDYYAHSILANSIRANKKRVVQIHLVPSVACHSIYGIHGYRHYNRRKLSKLATLYEDFSHSYIFPLGNETINEVHKKWAFGSSRETLRFTRPDEYVAIFRKVLVDHFTRPVKPETNIDPTFYALVIDSLPDPRKVIKW